MSGHYEDEAAVIEPRVTGAYGPLRCEHGALLAFRCELCWPVAPPAPEPKKIQIGPLDV
ncbi:hypothetical protein HNP55_003564 [Paucibacter oligotrophus]|uniref:Uncharacterized protein n=1 Tax=Roseateles oligotrophus TaxID=1769250 RepID=A0A840LFM8_9BURK|nr:hypothetical protein [Roseateles oligotrophus]MBB4845018.1 hypothetical protein [Roseateles oligotrophus]